jgi:metal-dependent hydrolase (beta-lactamase superfamily II)
MDALRVTALVENDRLPGRDDLIAEFGLSLHIRLDDREILFDTMAGSRPEVRAIADRILSYPVETVYSGHCTGRKGFRILKEVMGERLQHFPTGSTVEL